MGAKWVDVICRLSGVSVLLLSACAGYTPRVATTVVPTDQDAFLYGRFHIDAPKAWLAIDGHMSMGFALECADQQKYVLRFDRDKPVLAIKIKPASCSLTEIVYTNPDGQVTGRKPAPTGFSFKNLRFDAGRAYYMGDFDAGTSTTMNGTTVQQRWFIKSVRDNYALTTQDMRRDYPNLAQMSTANPLARAPVEVTPAQVRAEYDRIVAQLDAKEYKVRHILVDKQSQAQSALDRIKAGESFEAVAREVSQDPGSAKEGGDLGWNVPGNFTKGFSTSMKSLAPHGLSPQPVQTEFGWHVIEVTAERAMPIPPFDEVKDNIAERLRRRAQAG